MRYELPSWMSIKSTLRVEGAAGGAGGGFRRKREKYFSRPPPPRATCIIPDPRPLGTFENQGGPH